jgi:hypothetical protein
MNSNVRDCIVENYEYLIDSIQLPDPDDRHVVAAAIKSGANYIVTYNLRDFPESELAKYEIVAQHPDEFIFNQIDLNIAKVCDAVRSHRSSLKNPPFSQDDLLDCYLKSGLISTVGQLKQWKHVF